MFCFALYVSSFLSDNDISAIYGELGCYIFRGKIRRMQQNYIYLQYSFNTGSMYIHILQGIE